ncbi:methyltransferase-like protein 22 [Schistocerca serialis cubense]|uniref:methyltransferase-like protein 22 n=1 Tax=Schistocerca serialis cubense TaxID=2023355 RepID=UPI00214F046D|nr:methyltransferase-like protein 22 [Schistocerca serialis cubense]
MCDDEFKISSEIHLQSEVDRTANPSLSQENVVTRFTFRLSKDLSFIEGHKDAEVDEDGDFILQRRDSTSQDGFLLIEQKSSTPLELVGLQVWRGALLLSDFLLHNGKTLLSGHTVLELGAGAGLSSIVAAMFAHEVVSTDIDTEEILELIWANKERNKKWIKSKFSVMGFDFFAKKWSSELEEKLREVTTILAADVIYDNDLTQAFVDCLAKLLVVPPAKTVYVALEKRFVFTVADLDCVAPCYEHFLQCLSNIQRKPPGSNWTVEQLAIDFPQYFNYERVKELVLWKISS